jgi:hypothetical protein
LPQESIALFITRYVRRTDYLSLVVDSVGKAVAATQGEQVIGRLHRVARSGVKEGMGAAGRDYGRRWAGGRGKTSYVCAAYHPALTVDAVSNAVGAPERAEVVAYGVDRLIWRRTEGVRGVVSSWTYDADL